MSNVVSIDDAAEKVISSAEELLDCADYEYRKIHIPALKASVWFRSMTAEEAIDFTTISNDPRNKGQAFIHLFRVCACKGEGDPTALFTSSQVERLRKKNVKIFTHPQDELLDLNGFTREGQVKQETAAKND